MSRQARFFGLSQYLCLVEKYMLHLAFALVLSAAPVTAAAVPATPPPPPDPAATELAGRFAAVLKCEANRKEPGRHLCAVASVGKEPMWTPGQASTYLGISLKVKTGADLKKIGNEPLSLYALHLGAASAKLAPVSPASDADKAKLAALVDLVRGELKGEKKDALVVPEDILGRLRGERSKGRAPLKLDRSFAEFAGPAPTRLYRVDLATELGLTTGPYPAFVAVETASDGQQISIFPATPTDR
jgi:hypothetical protein